MIDWEERFNILKERFDVRGENIKTLKKKLERRENKIKELENYIENLQLENDELLMELLQSKNNQNLNDAFCQSENFVIESKILKEPSEDLASSYVQQETEYLSQPCFQLSNMLWKEIAKSNVLELFTIEKLEIQVDEPSE